MLAAYRQYPGRISSICCQDIEKITGELWGNVGVSFQGLWRGLGAGRLQLTPPSRRRLLLNLSAGAGVESITPECIITQMIRGDGMKTILNIIGVLLVLAGGVFFLQGINVLPGSYMTGDPQWAFNGGIMIVVAIVLMLWASRRK